MLQTQQIIDTLNVLPSQEHQPYLEQLIDRLSGEEHDCLVSDLADYLIRDPSIAERLEDGVLSAFGRPQIVEVIKRGPPATVPWLH